MPPSRFACYIHRPNQRAVFSTPLYDTEDEAKEAAKEAALDACELMTGDDE